MDNSHFLRGGPGCYASAPAVITHVIVIAAGCGVVVDVVDHRSIHVGDRAVVIENAVIPVSAIVAAAGISKAVIDATVKPDVRTPISTVPAVVTAFIIPIRRCPEGIDPGSHHPCSGHPIIAAVCPAPIAGCPVIVVARRGRLAVIGERRRRLIRLNRRLVGRVIVVVISRIVLRSGKIVRCISVVGRTG
jgi:hypothetical protein